MKNILLIGLGRFGRHIARQLNQMGHEIMAVDINEERVNKVLPFVTNAQIGNSTDAEFLESLGIGNFDICFVATGNNIFVKRIRSQNGHFQSRTRCSGEISLTKWC